MIIEMGKRTKDNDTNNDLKSAASVRFHLDEDVFSLLKNSLDV